MEEKEIKAIQDITELVSKYDNIDNDDVDNELLNSLKIILEILIKQDNQIRKDKSDIENYKKIETIYKNLRIQFNNVADEIIGDYYSCDLSVDTISSDVIKAESIIDAHNRALRDWKSYFKNNKNTMKRKSVYYEK